MPKITIDQKRIMFEMRTNDIKSLVDTTKQWIHVMDKREFETHFLLFQQCLRTIHKSENSTLYTFGPTVMRMLHFLNLPEKAIEVNMRHKCCL